MSSFNFISRLLFPVPPPTYGVDSFPKELIWVPKSLDPEASSPDDHVPCLFFPCASARFILLYLHSNGEDLGSCHQFCSTARMQFEVHVFAVEYPGYGICPGKTCNEQGVTENALTGLLFIIKILRWPLDSILLMGRSIGCGPALFLAVRYKVFGVIVVSPMLSFKERCRDLVGPLAKMVTERFPNKVWVPFIRSQLLVLHGQKDRIVPYRHGVELYKECRVHKQLVCPQNMAHNDNLFADAAYFAIPMFHFFPFPDYCFVDLQIPEWAYNKRRSSPFFHTDPVDVPLVPILPESTNEFCESVQDSGKGCDCRCLAIHTRTDEPAAPSMQKLFHAPKNHNGFLNATTAVEVPQLSMPSPRPSSWKTGNSPRQVQNYITRRPPEMQLRSASRNRLESKVANAGPPMTAGGAPAGRLHPGAAGVVEDQLAEATAGADKADCLPESGALAGSSGSYTRAAPFPALQPL